MTAGEIISALVAILVAALGSQWLGTALQDRFSKNSNGAIVRRLDALDHKVDRNDANRQRERILQFNVELLRKMQHTREDFVDVLATIDSYEVYCRDHPDYPNSRAVLAISNIRRIYQECMEEGTFL